MSLPNNTCAAGYFCRRDAVTATPNQGDDANICPVGHYCPEGTGEPTNCPLGTFGNDTGMYDQHQISPCNFNGSSIPDVMRIKDRVTGVNFFCDTLITSPQYFDMKSMGTR